jgi:predicted transposase/invertase (TIGR01784 family)
MGFCIMDIIYVNGSIRTDDSALGKLMSDFYCTKADGMYYKELSDKVRHYKESEEGVKAMCDIWEEVKKEGKIEGKLEASIENAKTMLRLGKLSLEEIAVCSGLSIEKVRELAGNKSA